MKIRGHGVKDHLRLLAPLFGLLTVVWALRLALGACGAPFWCSRIISMTGASAGCVLLAALLIHVRRFGSYPNVVMASLLLSIWAQLLIVAAILFAVITKTENIYTYPEFSIPHDDALHLKHIYGHLTFGIGFDTLFGAAVGCLLLWLLRTFVPMHEEEIKTGN